MKVDQVRCAVNEKFNVHQLYAYEVQRAAFRSNLSHTRYFTAFLLAYSVFFDHSISNDRKWVKSINCSELECKCNGKAQPYNRKNSALGYIHYIMIISIANYLISKKA